MISGYEKETDDLTFYERRIILPIVVEELRLHKGKDKAVSNAALRTQLQELGYDITGVRTRKIINHIRVNGLIECLAASRKGYYIARTKNEMKAYLYSLKNREEAIAAMRMALEEQIERMSNNVQKQ